MSITSSITENSHNFFFLIFENSLQWKCFSADSSTGSSCPPPELTMTEADIIVDPDSDEEPERKDSLDVHEEGRKTQSYKNYISVCLFVFLKLFFGSLFYMVKSTWSLNLGFKFNSFAIKSEKLDVLLIVQNFVLSCLVPSSII